MIWDAIAPIMTSLWWPNLCGFTGCRWFCVILLDQISSFKMADEMSRYLAALWMLKMSPSMWNILTRTAEDGLCYWSTSRKLCTCYPYKVIPQLIDAGTIKNTYQRYVIYRWYIYRERNLVSPVDLSAGLILSLWSCAPIKKLCNTGRQFCTSA